MSRIGKLPIVIPEGVEITVTDTNRIKVKGKLGELEQLVDPAIKVKQENGEVVLERPTESKDHKSKHGLYRSLINNMVKGVTEGFTIVQELVGVGYKAEVKNGLLDLSLGFSHHVIFQLPPEIKVEAVSDRLSILFSSPDSTAYPSWFSLLWTLLCNPVLGGIYMEKPLRMG